MQEARKGAALRNSKVASFPESLKLLFGNFPFKVNKSAYIDNDCFERLRDVRKPFKKLLHILPLWKYE